MSNVNIIRSYSDAPVSTSTPHSSYTPHSDRPLTSVEHEQSASLTSSTSSKRRSFFSKPSKSLSSPPIPTDLDSCGNCFCIFFINTKSGGREGEKILKKVNGPKLSGISMGFNLQEVASDPDFLSKFKNLLLTKLHGKSVKLIVGGGDGSVRWLMTVVDSIHYDPDFLASPLPLAILPLGTGNELSRCVGWSKQFNKPRFGSLSTSLHNYLKNVSQGQEITLDRWYVDVSRAIEPIDPEVCENGDTEPEKASVIKDFCEGQQFMVCFLSIGFDADISNNFHMLRERKPSYCGNRMMNKILYSAYGIEQMWKSFPRVSQFLELTVDGVVIPLPWSIRTLQVFNVNSSADGVDFFKADQPGTRKDLMKDHATPSINDGILEVVGTDDIFSLLAARFDLSHSRRLAQGREVSIRILGKDENTKVDWKKFPLQIDGEAWMAKRDTTIRISHRDHVKVVRGIGKTKGVHAHHHHHHHNVSSS